MAAAYAAVQDKPAEDDILRRLEIYMELLNRMSDITWQPQAKGAQALSSS